jgi:hypothetical protein
MINNRLLFSHLSSLVSSTTIVQFPRKFPPSLAYNQIHSFHITLIWMIGGQESMANCECFVDTGAVVITVRSPTQFSCFSYLYSCMTERIPFNSACLVESLPLSIASQITTVNRGTYVSEHPAENRNVFFNKCIVVDESLRCDMSSRAFTKS